MNQGINERNESRYEWKEWIKVWMKGMEMNQQKTYLISLIAVYCITLLL